MRPREATEKLSTVAETEGPAEAGLEATTPTTKKGKEMAKTAEVDPPTEDVVAETTHREGTLIRPKTRTERTSRFEQGIIAGHEAAIVATLMIVIVGVHHIAGTAAVAAEVVKTVAQETTRSTTTRRDPMRKAMNQSSQKLSRNSWTRRFKSTSRSSRGS